MEPLNKSADLSALRIDRDEPPRGRRLAWSAAATVFVVAVAVGLTWARRSGTVTLRPPEVTTTRVALVTPTQASTVLTASGYIVARSKAEISPKSVGRIAWLNLEEGQRVKKGELVARLESQELEAQKKQYLATKEQVLAQLENARRDRERAKALLEDRIGTQQAFDAADAQVRSLSAQIASIEQQVRYTEELIKNAEIYAPIDGVVTVKKAFLGETVAPQGFGGAGSAGATFAVIVDLGSLEMEADINEQNLGKLSLGQPAQVTLDAYPDRPYKARLRQIVPTADRQKGSVKVKVEILDKDARVLPEMSCRVVFLDPAARPAEGAKPKVMVPAGSVVEVGGKKGALFLEGDRAVFRPLGLGAAAGPQIEVVSGAAGGEEIVADAAGARSWRAEQKVRVKKD
ncbi:MAG TPA: efflux RND transporter periplasmic adaptor subunit [Thermoanaerobaculia bacterium]|nr:efflux RND transporter periplasmic adaptor subunit [Thermoanaerobaculia bacterium]HQR66062.1 efflux RND transporter periplasmic adaptor subunit [Thermoanaerobaculia bacterium]